jgi:hypothetical protein
MLPFNELADFAGVAELADAQDLGSCGLKTVEVQILSPAPTPAVSAFSKLHFSPLNCAGKYRITFVAARKNAKERPWSAALNHC